MSPQSLEQSKDESSLIRRFSRSLYGSLSRASPELGALGNDEPSLFRRLARSRSKNAPEVPFQYQPLDQSKIEIRLLRVFTAPPPSRRKASLSFLAPPQDSRSFDDENELDCWLEHVPLNTEISFTAVSYTWKQHQEIGLRKIILNGFEKCIGANLETALRHLRRLTNDRGEESIYIWADALCINQEDDVEKSLQVDLMPLIFARARCTVAWLGDPHPIRNANLSSSAIYEEDEDFRAHVDAWHEGSSTLTHLECDNGQNALTFLRKVGERVRSQKGYKNLPTKDSQIDKDLNILAKRMIRDLGFQQGSSSTPSRTLISIHHLVSLPWWSRVWVLQEVAISKQVVLTYGRTGLSWEILEAALIGFSKMLVHEGHDTYLSEANHQLILEIIKSTAAICESRMKYQTTGMSQSLRQVLCLTCTKGSQDFPMKATDPRDKIFALLGLATDARTLEIKPDYVLDYNVLCKAVAFAFINQGTINILSCCRYSPKNLQLGLPTWVPDWAAGIPVSIQSDTIRFSASKRPSKTKATKFLAQGPSLTLKTCFVDEIDRFLPPFEISNPSSTQTREWLHHVLEEFNGLSFGREAYGSTSRREKAIWKTTIADNGLQKDGSIQRASLENYNAYKVLVEQKGGPDNAFEIERYVAWYSAESYIYRASFSRVMDGRRLFVTKRGYLGLGPKEFQIEDQVHILLGAEVPYILREIKKGVFNLVGEAYVQGIMDGEFMSTKMKPARKKITLR